jgi:hypothetical protein
MIHYLTELFSGIFLVILDFFILIILDTDSILGYLHHEDVCNVTDVSELTRIFETTAILFLHIVCRTQQQDHNST